MESLVEGHEILFCWGSCYAPQSADFISPQSLPLSPNQESPPGENGFYAALLSNGKVGTSVVKFTFFNVGDESDNISYTATYKINGSSVDDYLNSNIFILRDAYPNPANDNVNFGYEANYNFSSASIEIYDQLATRNSQIPINSQTGIVNFSTLGLTSGYYYYNLIIDGEKVTTKRFLIVR